MVHALEKIHRLIKPGGCLIDIHPSGEPPSLEVQAGTRVTLAGWLHESDDYVEYGYADEALARVVESGLFRVERQGTFEFVMRADSLADLRAFLAEGWEDASIDDRAAASIEELMGGPEQDKEVLLREVVRIVRLRPVPVRQSGAAQASAGDQGRESETFEDDS